MIRSNCMNFLYQITLKSKFVEFYPFYDTTTKQLRITCQRMADTVPFGQKSEAISVKGYHRM